MARIDLARIGIVGTVGLLAHCTVFSGLTAPPDPSTGEAGAAPKEDGASSERAEEGAVAIDSGNCTAADRYASLVLEDNPVAYFRFEGGDTQVSDSTGRGNQCTLGRGTKRVGGPFGCSQGISLDGTGGIDCGRPFTFPPNKPFAIEMWIRPRATNKNFHRVITNEGDPRSGFNLYVSEGSIGLGAELELLSGGSYRCGEHVATPAEKWTYVLAQYDGLGSIRVHANDEKPKFAECGTDVPGATTRALTLGKAAVGDKDFFSGDIDDLAIYDHMLPEGRITARLDALR